MVLVLGRLVSTVNKQKKKSREIEGEVAKAAHFPGNFLPN